MVRPRSHFKASGDESTLLQGISSLEKGDEEERGGAAGGARRRRAQAAAPLAAQGGRRRRCGRRFVIEARAAANAFEANGEAAEGCKVLDLRARAHHH